MTTNEAVKAYTADETRQALPEDTISHVNRWLARGDGIAIYENHDFNHPDLGHLKFVSFGSSAAQLETAEPPSRLPDIGSEINWRYTLIGTYRGGEL